MQDEAMIALLHPTVRREQSVHDSGVDEIGVDQRDHEPVLACGDGFQCFPHRSCADEIMVADQTNHRHFVDVVGVDR